ncbi:hypothetical protein Q8A73_009498 [Channa argus]|nr:hypothetical protein Q8A73_009498 [Channa argus]
MASSWIFFSNCGFPTLICKGPANPKLLHSPGREGGGSASAHRNLSAAPTPPGHAGARRSLNASGSSSQKHRTTINADEVPHKAAMLDPPHSFPFSHANTETQVVIIDQGFMGRRRPHDGPGCREWWARAHTHAQKHTRDRYRVRCVLIKRILPGRKTLVSAGGDEAACLSLSLRLSGFSFIRLGSVNHSSAQLGPVQTILSFANLRPAAGLIRRMRKSTGLKLCSAALRTKPDCQSKGSGAHGASGSDFKRKHREIPLSKVYVVVPVGEKNPV